MNKSYKVIFNVSKGFNTVVSEIAKSFKKTKATKLILGSVLSGLALGGINYSSTAFASNDIYISILGGKSYYNNTSNSYSDTKWVGVDGKSPNLGSSVDSITSAAGAGIKTDAMY